MTSPWKGQHESAEVVEAAVTAAVFDLRAAVKAELHLEFSGPKQTVIVARGELAKKLAGTLGDEKVKDTGMLIQAKQLGIDQTAGKRVLFTSNRGSPRSREDSRKANRE